MKLSETEIQRRFLAYLEQRGVVKLTSFCTALNQPIQAGYGGKKIYHFAHKVDGIVTPLLASPECRVESGRRTAHWEVRYYAKLPREQSFAPRLQGQVTAYVDPSLKGSWRRGDPTTDNELEARRLRRERQAAFDAALAAEREEAREWVKDVVPEPSPPSTEPPSPPSPLSQGGEGGQEAEIPPAPPGKGGDEDDETTTTEIEDMARARRMARKTEECVAVVRGLLVGIADWPDYDLLQSRVMEKGNLSSGFLAKHPELKREVIEALEAEKARRAAVFSEAEQSEAQDSEPSPPSTEPPSPPSPLSQGGEGELEPEIPPAPLGKGGEEPEPEPFLEEVREDYERQIRELREELERTAAVGLREKLEAQIEALDLELMQTRNEIRQLEGELDRRTADLMALRRTAELLGV